MVKKINIDEFYSYIYYSTLFNRLMITTTEFLYSGREQKFVVKTLNILLFHK